MKKKRTEIVLGRGECRRWITNRLYRNISVPNGKVDTRLGIVGKTYEVILREV